MTSFHDVLKTWPCSVISYQSTWFISQKIIAFIKNSVKISNQTKSLNVWNFTRVLFSGEKHRKFAVPNLTVKRSFTARNTGDLPIYVTGFNINGLPCEGYGFRILNCGAFHLPPHGTHKIDIEFTPDFTLARIQRTLTIDTSLGIPVNYTLITTLPPYFLASCSSVLGRPSWEPLLYYSAVSFMAFLLFCVLAAAFLESDRILKCALITMTRERAAVAPSDSKQNSSSGQKNGDAKSYIGKPETASDWNLSSSVQQTEKHSRGPHNSTNSVGLCNKNNIWTGPVDSHVTREADTKERLGCTKCDDPEVVYSHHSPPLLTVKNKKKVGKRNSNNSDTCSLSESLHEIPVLKRGWGSVFSRSSQGASIFKSRQTEGELRGTENTVHYTDVESNSKKIVENGKDGKRVSQDCKKNKIQQEPTVCSEEETSSTTTESSNNDEIERVSTKFVDKLTI